MLPAAKTPAGMELHGVDFIAQSSGSLQSNEHHQFCPAWGNLRQLYIFNVTEPLMRRLSDVELIADEYSRVWDAQDDFKQLSANAICRCRMLVGAEGSGLENDFGQVVI